MQSGRLKFKHAAIIICKLLQYHATWKGLSFKRRRCQAKWEVPSPQHRLTLQNAENIAHTTRNSFLCFCVFSGLDGFASCSFFLALQSCNWGFLDFMALLVFTATKTTSIRKSQTLPISKQLNKHRTISSCWCVPPGTPTHNEKTTTNNQQRLADSMPNARFQLQNAAKSKQNGRFQLQNATNRKQNGRFQLQMLQIAGKMKGCSSKM